MANGIEGGLRKLKRALAAGMRVAHLQEMLEFEDVLHSLSIPANNGPTKAALKRAWVDYYEAVTSLGGEQHGRCVG